MDKNEIIKLFDKSKDKKGKYKFIKFHQDSTYYKTKDFTLFEIANENETDISDLNPMNYDNLEDYAQFNKKDIAAFTSNADVECYLLVEHDKDADSYNLDLVRVLNDFAKCNKKCPVCNTIFQYTATYERGFSDYENLECPICKYNFGEIRADWGIGYKILKEGHKNE
ncbi:MAG: hypothetical protein AMDU4_FER2C00009G0002 [Ferroplasma sp. Type II]|jgi:hypothetical protein|uniref:hypothetical protein n=1 Tax=Ferroplasma sp. Type II TaxID=261388 RepID=UPI00038960C6|nr:hypothetical protein [Ferroplasma sp. Type II]EQB74426.1 MAG: hypothetical protein AMDU4_FER2C00009G0002 [Ferroplasma sp. Type II]HII82441.1 hypothetical protein [Ferroplasma sp.]